MGRPFIIYINLSNILKDQEETQYTMYIDDTKMTIVYELIEWIQWIFSLTHCVYLTHENSVIHELEDIKILSVLTNVKVQNCYHFPCVHTKFNHLFKKLSSFTQWDGIKVPKLFLNKVNEITQKFIHKDGSNEVMINGCNEEESTTPNERKVESNKIKEMCSSNINTCENQLSENLNSNMCGSNKTNFNINSNIKLDETVVKIGDSNKVHSVLSAKSDFVDVCNNSATNFKVNSNTMLDNTAVGISNSHKVHSPLSDKYEFVHVNSINKVNIISSDLKHYDTIPTDTALGMKNSNNVQSVLPNKNEFVNPPIKISESEIEQIKSLVDIKLSANTEYTEDEETNKSNRKRIQSILHDKKLNCNKIIKKGPKPFSVGEILTSLRCELSTSCDGCESNTFSTEHNQNSSISNVLINNRLECSDQNSPNDIDVIVTKMKRKRIRRHRPKRLMSRGSKLNNSPKQGENTSESVASYIPFYKKQSSHIRFTSDDEDFFKTNNSESDKQPEKTQDDLSQNNELVENGMRQSCLKNEKEETLSMTPSNALNAFNKNDESKQNESSEANKEFSTLDKLMLVHDQKSSSDSLYEYSNEENQQISSVAKTPDNYDFNLSTLKTLKEKFPSPMVVERFY